MKLQKGINDLATTFPELLSEWVYEKNDINPNDIYYGSTKVVWWKCPTCNNLYDTSVRIRTGGSNCPYCSGQRVLIGFNDLSTWCKKNDMEYLLEEWDENNNISPYEVTRGTRKKILWNCKECGNTWEAPIVSRTKGSGCPECGKKKIWKVRFQNIKNNKVSIFDSFPELKSEWDFDKNTIDPLTLSAGSGIKVWWKCKNCGYSWETSVVNRTKGKGCPECGIKKIWEVRRVNLLNKKGSLFDTNPELEDEWDFDKNIVDPLSLTSGSHKKVWWKCKKCEFIWEANVASRTRGRGCPSCGKESGLLTRHINKLESKGSLFDNNPIFLREWDYENNTNISPQSITVNSTEKVWWICSVCGYNWKARVDHRFNGVGCPQCAREKQSSFPEQAVFYFIKKVFPDAINGDKNLISPYELDIYIPLKNIAIEYDGQAFHKYTKRDIKKNELCKNKGIYLYRIREKNCIHLEEDDNVTCIYVESGNNADLCDAITVLLRMICNEELDINIERDYNAILDQYIHKKKEDSLGKKYPELLQEWDYNKNGKVTPEMVSTGSDKMFWWKCINGHSYKTSVANKVGRNRGCPYCTKKKLLVGFNDFATCYPEIASEWDYDKNEIKPYDVIGGAKKIWWKCPKDHSYYASMNSRTNRKSGCPVCAGLKIIEGINDLKTVSPDLADEWDYLKNGELKPENVGSGSGKKVWWICPKGHSYEMAVNSRKKSGCPYCANKRVLSGFNDLKTRFPLISSEWDNDKNELKPDEITPFSSKKVWWKCPRKHSYIAAVSERTGHNTGCPFCCNRKVLIGFNDLSTCYPDLVLEWDFDKNSFAPQDVVYGTPKKAWWKCKCCGYSWEASISTRTQNGYGCPKCARNNKSKKHK